MALLDELYIVAAVAALTIGTSLRRRELRPGRAAFVMFMVYGILLCSVESRGRPSQAPFWIGPTLGLMVTPFLYGLWVLAQLPADGWPHHHDKGGRMATRSKTYDGSEQR